MLSFELYLFMILEVFSALFSATMDDDVAQMHSSIGSEHVGFKLDIINIAIYFSRRKRM